MAGGMPCHRLVAQEWKDRFKRVVLSAGYGEKAACSIVEEYFPKYWNGDLVEFDKMMTDYETQKGDPL